MESLKIIDDLNSNDWLTNRTKAVLVQMTLYNANTNLFTQVKIWWEKTSIGRVFLKPVVQSFRLYTYVGSMGIITLAVQALWMILLGYFFVNEILVVKKTGKTYFQSVFNIGYWIHLLLALTSIGLFIGRIPFIVKAVEKVHNTQGWSNYSA